MSVRAPCPLYAGAALVVGVVLGGAAPARAADGADARAGTDAVANADGRVGVRHWCITDDPAYRARIRKLEEATAARVDAFREATMRAVWEDWKRCAREAARHTALPPEQCPDELPADADCLAAVSGDPFACDEPSAYDPVACRLLAAVAASWRAGTPTPCAALEETPTLAALCAYATGEALHCPPPKTSYEEGPAAVCQLLADPQRLENCLGPDADRPLCGPARFLHALHSRLPSWCPPPHWGATAATCRAALFRRFDLCPPSTSTCSFPLWWCAGDVCAVLNLSPLRAHCRVHLASRDVVLPVEVPPQSSSPPLRLPPALRGRGPLRVECRWERAP